MVPLHSPRSGFRCRPHFPPIFPFVLFFVLLFAGGGTYAAFWRVPVPCAKGGKTLGEVSLQVGSASTNCGSTVSIPVSVYDAAGVDAFAFTLNYDASKLSYISVVAGGAISDWASASGNESALGQVNIGGFRGLGTPVNGDGQLVVIVLRCDACLSSSTLRLSNLADGVAGASTASGTVVCGEEGEGEPPSAHAADWHGSSDNLIDLTELLRVIQVYNSSAYHCAQPADISDDGFVCGMNPGAQSCAAHSADYNPQDWKIGLSELLRVIQFYNSNGYHVCAESEDGFCPGPPV